MRKGKPLFIGTVREVIDAEGDIAVIACYTVPYAAAAVGKSIVTFKKWIVLGYVPAPIYKDATFHHLQYSVPEVQAIVTALSRHFDKFDYLNKRHKTTIKNIAAGIDKVRSA